MPHAEWGCDPDFFGPRHAHREGRILAALAAAGPRPGPHLECAAGVGSLSGSLAAGGRTVVATDLSLRSLSVTAARTTGRRGPGKVLPVLADITRLPFADSAFTSATSAETLEHVPDDRAAARELARVLAPGGVLVGTVPAGPSQWSAWDDWAGHLRRYTRQTMAALLTGAGLQARAVTWGWPLLRLYDTLFLGRVNRRRLESEGPIEGDPALRTVARLGGRRWLVRLVRAVFGLDRVFDGCPWGVGLLFLARRPAASGGAPRQARDPE